MTSYSSCGDTCSTFTPVANEAPLERFMIRDKRKRMFIARATSRNLNESVAKILIQTNGHKERVALLSRSNSLCHSTP